MQVHMQGRMQVHAADHRPRPLQLPPPHSCRHALLLLGAEIPVHHHHALLGAAVPSRPQRWVAAAARPGLISTPAQQLQNARQEAAAAGGRPRQLARRRRAEEEHRLQPLHSRALDQACGWEGGGRAARESTWGDLKLGMVHTHWFDCMQRPCNAHAKPCKPMGNPMHSYRRMLSHP